jgi:hypothetical protein
LVVPVPTFDKLRFSKTFLEKNLAFLQIYIVSFFTTVPKLVRN